MTDKQQQPPRWRSQQTHVVRHAEANRYELYVEDALAGTIEYRAEAGRLTLVSTAIEPAFAGHGLGSRLVAGALDDARATGERVVTECEFVDAYIKRHPEYNGLIDTRNTAT